MTYSRTAPTARPRPAENAPLRIAMVGTRGVPARYGGFETAIEEVGSRLVRRGHSVVVYCRDSSTAPADRPTRYKGMELVFRPALKSRTLETLSHTGLSVAHLLRHRTDVALVFNAANAPFLPLLRAARVPVATHVDGLEWQRAKWGPMGSRYYRFVERLAVAQSDALIADAVGISDYYRSKFDADTALITYGAPRISGIAGDRLGELGLVANGFHLIVARFEPENHVDMIVDGYTRSGSTLPLIVVGSAPYADTYTRRVHQLADQRVRFLGGVWDQDLLDQLYAHCRLYWHGHSVGGTNPSLLRAIGAGTAGNAFDVSFNREVLGAAGNYFSTAQDVRRLVESDEADEPMLLRRRAAAEVRAGAYDWDDVTDGYEDLCRRLAAGRSRRQQRGTQVVPAGRIRFQPAGTQHLADAQLPTQYARSARRATDPGQALPAMALNGHAMAPNAPAMALKSSAR